MTPAPIDPAHARLSPATFAKFLHPERTIPRHIRHMAQVVRDAIFAGDGRIIVTMPPRHAKSDTISIHTPAWFLDLFPERHVMLASYAFDKAAEWGREVRNLIDENPGKFFTRLSEDSTAAGKWKTPEGGGMMCAGVGGPLTGSPGELIIVDDPVKNEEEASSETMREKVWRWFRSVVLTRTEPGATIVVVMTRWNEDDLVGRILENQRQHEEAGEPHHPWTVINFPCIAEEEDILGRTVGDPLWPERGYDREWADKKRIEVGSRVWTSLYQQRPNPEAGAIFQRKHFRYFLRDGDTLTLLVPGGRPKMIHIGTLRWFQVADTAQKVKTLNDYTVCGTFALTPGRDFLVFDVARDRLEVPDQLPYLDRQWDRFPRVVWQGIEDAASGTGLIQTAARLGRPRRPMKPVVDKVTRSGAASVWYENGMIYHPREASWLEDFEGELLSFPNGRFDDQVDMISYAVRECGAALAVPFGPAGEMLPTARTREEREELEELLSDRDHPHHAVYERNRGLSGLRPGGSPFG